MKSGAGVSGASHLDFLLLVRKLCRYLVSSGGCRTSLTGGGNGQRYLAKLAASGATTSSQQGGFLYHFCTVRTFLDRQDIYVILWNT